MLHLIAEERWREGGRVIDIIIIIIIIIIIATGAQNIFPVSLASLAAL